MTDEDPAERRENKRRNTQAKDRDKESALTNERSFNFGCCSTLMFNATVYTNIDFFFPRRVDPKSLDKPSLTLQKAKVALMLIRSNEVQYLYFTGMFRSLS